MSSSSSSSEKLMSSSHWHQRTQVRQRPRPGYSKKSGDLRGQLGAAMRWVGSDLVGFCAMIRLVILVSRGAGTAACHIEAAIF